MDIKPQYEHTKFGTFMFNICAGGTKFLVKHRGLYYLLACTGGIILTAIGGVITLILFIVKFFDSTITFEKYHGIYYIKVGLNYGGGFEMGLMFCRDHLSSDSYINPHEYGHSFQNTLLGPLMPFIIAIPSAARYWAREIGPNKKGKAYDAAGFEDNATQCGKYIDWYLNLSKEDKENIK